MVCLLSSVLLIQTLLVFHLISPYQKKKKKWLDYVAFWVFTSRETKMCSVEEEIYEPVVYLEDKIWKNGADGKISWKAWKHRIIRKEIRNLNWWSPDAQMTTSCEEVRNFRNTQDEASLCLGPGSLPVIPPALLFLYLGGSGTLNYLSNCFNTFSVAKNE